ncbi:glycosyltransferase [Acetatifactor aquisgranensis]|uniref:glycosyltransferase n=1 Tax=Acetatifactor aquisgranensis TaxID=2941233 RepID=UPI00204084F1|nr:glycosyltransferase [Acetatifactor aquisgranensis]
MKRISVVIPMYNGEAFIGQCVRSVTCQTYRNLEIIVVDDGSTDNGAAVCEELMGTDERIRLCRQENGGVSAARNHGIEVSTGEYVFFLDSDDAIHPRLLEEMLGQAEANHAQLVFCVYRKLDSSRMETVLAGTAERPGKGASHEGQTGWLTADEAGTEEWFHVKYTDILSGIGGKLILREAIGNLRFDTELKNGEDTFFLYQLVRGQVRSAYCPEEWYYYRMHGESVTNSAGTAKGMRYFESARRIRDGEYDSGHADHAMRWEILVADQIRRNYGAQKSGGADKARRELRRIAAAERRHPMFRRICFSDRVLFVCCFACYPVYVVLNKIVLFLTNRRSR